MKTKLLFTLLILALLITTNCAVSKNNTDKQTNRNLNLKNITDFRKAFFEMSNVVLKDSLKIADDYKRIQINVEDYEKKHQLKYEDIAEWVSINYHFKFKEIKKDFFENYYLAINTEIYDSNSNFIDFYSGKNKSTENSQDNGMFIDFGTEALEEESTEKTNYILEEYQRLSLEMKEREFKYNVVLVFSVFSENYNTNVINLLGTDEFKFKEIIEWLKVNKKEHVIELLKPAILQKTFKIAYKTMFVKQ